MAKISAKKSDLKTIANKIIVSPSTAAVSDLKFKRKKDFSTFVKWIESSNKALAGIKLPKKKEVEKLGKGSGGGFPWLLALLGLGGVGALALAASKMGDGDGDKIDGAQKFLLQDEIRTGTDFSGKMPSEFKVPKNKPFKIKNIKTGGDKNKKIKSSTLKKANKGTKPGKVKIDKGKITSSKKIGKAPEIPKKIEVKTEKVLKKNPLKKVKLNKGFKGFLKGTASKVGGVLAVADVAHTTVDRLQEGQNVKQATVGAVAEGAGSWYGFGGGFKLGSVVTGKLAAPLLFAPFPGARPLYVLATLAGGIAGGFAGSKLGREMAGGLADRFTGVLNKAQAKDKKISVKEKKKRGTGVNGNVTTVPFPVITNQKKETEIIPIPIGNGDGSSSSSSSMTLPSGDGVNSTLENLLLTRL